MTTTTLTTMTITAVTLTTLTTLKAMTTTKETILTPNNATTQYIKSIIDSALQNKTVMVGR
jgi:hypothetical protein